MPNTLQLNLYCIIYFHSLHRGLLLISNAVSHNLCRGAVSAYYLLLVGLLLHWSGIVGLQKSTSVFKKSWLCFECQKSSSNLTLFCKIQLMLSFTRKKEIRKMRRKMADGHSFAFLCDDVDELEHSVQQKLPMVSVVMPLKGFGEHNLQNWRTQVQSVCNIFIHIHAYIINYFAIDTHKKIQITSLYGGPLEFLFVVESKDDPAYRAVSRLIVEYKVSESPGSS